MSWPKRTPYKSPRFEDADDVIKFFADCQEAPNIDAIMFLAEQVKQLEERLESLDNYVTGYDP